VYLHAFDDPGVIAGQGTVGLELLEQNPYLRTIVVPIGGGGLIGGIGCAIKEINPRIRVIGVESEAFPSMLRAREAGHPVELPSRSSIAEGIAVRRVGEHTFDLANRYVDEIVTVSEAEIANAILLLLEEEKVVAEGAGAAGLAAIVAGKVPDAVDRRTAVIICGGNIDTNLMSTILGRGLVQAGRRIQLTVNIPDIPGSLARLTTRLGELRANILEIHHEREFSPVALGETEVTVVLETRGNDHIAALTAALEAEGFVIPVMRTRLTGPQRNG
jgi:threonine dehydratase